MDAIADADEAIRELVESERFLSGSIERRYAYAQGLIDKLEQAGLIKDPSYDGASELFSFMYPDGSLGGISLNTFDSELN